MGMKKILFKQGLASCLGEGALAENRLLSGSVLVASEQALRQCVTTFDKRLHSLMNGL